MEKQYHHIQTVCEPVKIKLRTKLGKFVLFDGIKVVRR